MRMSDPLKSKIQGAKRGQARWMISIPSNRERIHNVLKETDAWLRKQHFGEQVVHDVTLAVIEATNNAIFHGNQADPRKKVCLSFSLSPRELVVTVADQGKGFDLRRIPRHFPAHPSLAGHGRGVLLMRSLVDEVGFEKRKGGLCVRLVKRRGT